MANWVTHLIIADSVLTRFPVLDRHSFCVGNIAPDCNVENDDWTAFTPSREKTHWMQGKRKQLSDCDMFCKAYILNRKSEIQSSEEYAFLLGYYAHLITDAAFQAMIRDEDRVKAAWRRIKSDDTLSARSLGMPEIWDSVKTLMPSEERAREIHAIEADYLAAHPESGYFTEILPLKTFPDYIDYLPQGAIARKVKVMSYLPEVDKSVTYIAWTPDEYASFIENTIALIVAHFSSKGLL